MSVNKYMHPRNIYKTPPNFKQMAIDYPDFRKYVTQVFEDITGKIHIDFKNNETLRALTTTLLKKDFELDVFIPLDRLIPTVPLRLNYILWIEDLLSISPECDQTIQGIDIGTGASCIYPLLGSKLNKWKMMATEIDVDSLNIAQQNVQRNNLQHLIFVIQSTSDSLLGNVLETGNTYDFCMCNPPFYSSTNELDPKNKARTERRTLPRNAPSGMEGEVVAPGGELEFISKLIHESSTYKTQVRIYTTMIGHKTTLFPLKRLLRSLDVVSFKQTEFHQGHTTRWGLAWTFHNIDLRKVPQATVAAARKKPKPPVKHIIPLTDAFSTLEQVVTKVKELFQALEFEYVELKRSHCLYAFEAKVDKNTWSNQRRKRREKLRYNESSCRNNKNETSLNDNTMEVDKINVSNSHTNGASDVSMELDTSGENKRSRVDDSDDDEYYAVKKLKTDAEPQVAFFKITVVVKKYPSEFHLEMVWVEGSTSKDSVYQVMQYFKNNLK